MKTSKVWEALQEYYRNVKPEDFKKAYIITPQIMAPIQGFRPVDGQLKIVVESTILSFDMDSEFDARIELYKDCTSLGSYTDFPPLPNDIDVPEINLSYHNVTVYCGDTAYEICDNYAYILSCTKCGGWSLWYKWEGKEELLGAEYGDASFCISVAGRAIVGSIPEAAKDADVLKEFGV